MSVRRRLGPRPGRLTLNRKVRAHDIDEYLSAIRVAAEIGQATARE
jgi:hypothetical protein